MPYSPAFQFYPGDYLGDKNTIPMTTVMHGAYCLLMWFSWENDGLPDDIEELADMAKLSVEEFTPMWSRRIKKCFVWDEKKKVYLHPRHLKEIRKQKSWKKEKSERGKKAAASRWNKTTSGDASAMHVHADAMHSNASLSSSSSPSPRRKKKYILRPLPDDFEITEGMRKWFAEHCPSVEIEAETRQFKDRCIANGTEYKNWEAGWRTQMANAEKWSHKGQKPKGNGYDPRKDIMSPEYEMPPSGLDFTLDADAYFAGPHNDGTEEKYEQMKRNWLTRPKAKNHAHEIEKYEQSARFRERFSQAG